MAVAKWNAFGWSDPKNLYAGTNTVPTPGSLQAALDRIKGGPLSDEFFEDHYHNINKMTSADRIRRFTSGQLHQLDAYEKNMAAVRQRLIQEQQDKFKTEARAKGACALDDDGSVAYDCPLEVCRDLYIAAGYGATWVQPLELSPVHYNMFLRLNANNMMEERLVADMQSMTFHNRYRLKGT